MKGVLLINLGTPDEPTVASVRKFHHEFFSDAAVFVMSNFNRWVLRNLIIKPFRSPKITKLYQEIWMDEGSPLLIYSKRVKAMVQHELGNEYVVEIAMRYGNPSIKKAINKLQKLNLEALIIIPTFPQTAAATTGSIFTELATLLKTGFEQTKIHKVSSFYDHPTFLRAWKERASVFNYDDYDQVIFSYHGVPESHITNSDPGNFCLKGTCCNAICDENKSCYKAHCEATSRGIAKVTNLPEEHYVTGFQSRFGKEPWIEPYLDDVIKKCAQENKKKLLVYSPAFVADCLETVHEIAIEYNEVFISHGGEKITLVPSLNDHPTWAQTIKDIVIEHSI